MFNKLMVGSLTTALLFGGAFQTTADASASEDKSQNQSTQHKVYYSINGSDWSERSSNRFSTHLNNCFLHSNWNNQDNDGEEQTAEQEQSKQDKPEQNQEQPKNNDKSDQAADKQQGQQNNQQEAGNQQGQQNDQQDADNQQEEQTEQPEAQAPQQPAEQENEQQNQSQTQQLNEFEQQVVELTNQEREAQGLEPLKVDTELSNVAREKSRDMATSNYFSHDSPNYGSPFDMMKDFGISYQTAGENIARGQTTPEQVVDGWMNSEGHRENIMNSDFTHIGVGYVEQGNHWTQQFIGK